MAVLTQHVAFISSELGNEEKRIIKFKGDTTVVGLIQRNDDSVQKEEVKQLEGLCRDNNMVRNRKKKKKSMIIDFTPLSIRNYVEYFSCNTANRKVLQRIEMRAKKIIEVFLLCFFSCCRNRSINIRDSSHPLHEYLDLLPSNSISASNSELSICYTAF